VDDNPPPDKGSSTEPFDYQPLDRTQWIFRGGAVAVAVLIVLVIVYAGFTLNESSHQSVASAESSSHTSVNPKAPPAPPPMWSEITSHPNYQSASPEERLVVFARWYNDAYNYASKQPDWNQVADQFTATMAARAAELSKAAGGLTPDEARVKIAKDTLAAKQQELGLPLTADQEWEVLRQLPADVYSAYYQHTGTAKDQSSQR
jgi:cell division protein FtsN